MPIPKTDAEILINRAICYPLVKLARELDGCSPELRRLVQIACDGANGQPRRVPDRDKTMARQRLLEAANTRTKEAKAKRRVAALVALGGPAQP